MKFKTNINCAGCVATVTPILNTVVGEGAWTVDTNQPGKPLTIMNEDISAASVTTAITMAGFKIESL